MTLCVTAADKMSLEFACHHLFAVSCIGFAYIMTYSAVRFFASDAKNVSVSLDLLSHDHSCELNTHMISLDCELRFLT